MVDVVFQPEFFIASTASYLCSVTPAVDAIFLLSKHRFMTPEAAVDRSLLCETQIIYTSPTVSILSVFESVNYIMFFGASSAFGYLVSQSEIKCLH